MVNYSEDNIVALATPAGSGAISVIRLSGKKSIEIVDEVFINKNKLANSKSHKIHYGKIVNKQNEVIDDVLVSVFKGPNSYTGENSIEISCHGSQYIVQKIINEILKYDIRLAEPGEFTRRAFLNGKLDLAQAEAVADVIKSSTEASLRGAREQLNGMLSSKVKFLRKELIESSSLLELELDFAEDDIEFVDYNVLKNKIELIINEIDKLIDSFKFGKVIRDGVNVALVGRPNVGKSSLLNYLLKESRAIVSNIPGTTRDIIREELTIDGVLFIISDTAGLCISDDIIEMEGVKRSQQAIKESDLVICMGDVEQGVDETWQHINELIERDRIVTVINKIDLKKNNFKSDLNISSTTGEGIEDLLKELKKRALGTWNYSEHNAVVSNIRHYNILKKTKESLLLTITSLNQKQSNEFVAVDLNNAINTIGEIIGEVTSDDVLNNIFSEFCIGK